METFHKAYKFRLYPSEEQAVMINKTIGPCRSSALSGFSV
ncbi:helix-turn-helix domain-containing protein [Neobacillus cucumis]|nr:helix-turn-helix domain-containing protein [Neobacillus cucumis]MBI0581229.1 helix-turn-helix domain-containing protein [Neobacillus cucumis]